MFRVMFLGFLVFTTFCVVAPTSVYAISLDDEEEDAEDVADMLAAAQKAGKSEEFGKADALLKEAKMYGVKTDKTQETEKLIASKKAAKAERERKERERLARIKREKEERARQARMASQRQASRSNRYITSLGYDAPRYQYDKYTLWYRPYISISDGSHIWAKVTQLYRGACYELLVGSSDSSIYGNCSNCSNSTNSYWSCHANGSGSFTVNGNQAEAANGIVQRSR